MNNLNKIYHKGKYRNGEWAKHLRPYLKRVGNKRWRKDGKKVEISENLVQSKKRNRLKRTISVKITEKFYGDLKWTTITRYRTIRDALNAMRQANVIKAEILK